MYLRVEVPEGNTLPLANPVPLKVPAPLTEKLRIELLQLSPVETGLIPETIAEQLSEFVFTLRFAGQTIVGKVVSITVTAKAHEPEFPFTSVAINVSL